MVVEVAVVVVVVEGEGGMVVVVVVVGGEEAWEPQGQYRVHVLVVGQVVLGPERG